MAMDKRDNARRQFYIRRKFDTVPKIVFLLVAMFVMLFVFTLCLRGVNRKLSTPMYVIMWVMDLGYYFLIFRYSYKFSMDFYYLIHNTEQALETEDSSIAYRLKNGARYLMGFGVYFTIKNYKKGRYMVGLGVSITVFAFL